MLNLYVSNQTFGLVQSSSFGQDGWGRTTPFDMNKDNNDIKSKRNSIQKERSNLSEKSRKRSMVSANSHVHFN